MVYLVGAEETAPAGLPERIRQSLSREAGYTVSGMVILGMRARRVTIENPTGQGSILRRNIARAAAALRDERAGRIIFADGFAYKEHLKREGFDEMGTDALLAALAGRVAALAAPDGAAAALVARHLAGGAWNTLRELCLRFRCVMAVTDADWNPGFAELRRRTGVSIIEHPSARQLALAGVAVLYDDLPPGVVLAEHCVAVGGAVRRRRGPRARPEGDRPVSGAAGGSGSRSAAGFPREPILAAALSAGTLSEDDIQINGLSVS